MANEVLTRAEAYTKATADPVELVTYPDTDFHTFVAPNGKTMAISGYVIDGAEIQLVLTKLSAGVPLAVDFSTYLNRSNHTGTQTLSTINDAGTMATLNKPSVRTTTGADTTTDADFNVTILMADTHTVALHSTTETSLIGQTIVFRLRGATQQTISAGTATIEGNAIINQHETVTATLYAVGAGTSTIWGLTGGSAT